MTTLRIKFQTKAGAKDLLQLAYNADPSACYRKKANQVFGSVINACVENDEVVVTSSYYTEYSLKQAMNQL